MFKTSLIAVIWISASTMVLAQPGSEAMRNPLAKNAAPGHSATESHSAKSGATKSALPKSTLPKSGATKSCAEFGPGFVRAEGSDTCVRIGGSIGIGVGGGSGRSGGLR